MTGKYALIIGNTEYADPGLARLVAPSKDAEDFARVLQDRNLCCFDNVKVLLNQASSFVLEAIDEFFDQKKPDDMLVLYFSGHGVRDEYGALYLAFNNTIRSRLRSTAIKDDYIRGAMDQSRSKRQVVILDCCNSGAFPQGTKAEIGGVMGLTQAFQGYGRFVLTASDATQFAWEGDKVIGDTDNSLFTHFLVKGLEGEADADGDGKITVDELYDYAYEQISRVTEKQTPTKSSSKQEGEFILRQITRMEDIRPVPLPEDLISEIEDPRPYVREPAVKKLEIFLRGKNLGLAHSARQALEKIAREDDSRTVAAAAQKALESSGVVLAITSQEIGVESPRQQLRAPEQQPAKKTTEIAKKRAEAERLAQTRAEAIRAEREKKQQELMNKASASVETPGVRQAVLEKPNRPLLRWSVLLGMGGLIILIVGIVAGMLIFRPWFPGRPTSVITPGSPVAAVPVPVSTTEVPVVLPPSEDIPSIATEQIAASPTPDPTRTRTPTATPFSPPEPDRFINFYFETVIDKREYDLAWSLLSETFKANNNSAGFNDWKNTWERVVEWRPPAWSARYITQSMAVVSTPEIWFRGSSWYSLRDREYCLVRDESRNTWIIEAKEVCGL